jgi:1,4-alpha-glucan branching enzyme
MVKKQFVKTRNVAKVTFEVAADVAADEVQLVADFTDWRPVAFGRLKNGRWKLVQELEPGRSYQYRYRLLKDGAVDYRNDEHPDGLVGNVMGTENAVLTV